MRPALMILVACSAPPAPPVARTAPPMVAAEPPAPITCSDAGVILRGAVVDERDAGPMKEAAIARACLQGAWSTEVRACIGDATTPATCLAQLAEPQQRGYRAQLEQWVEAFPEEPLDEAAADDDHLAFVDCAVAVGDAAKYAPVLTQPKGEARELATALRRQHLLALCEDWTPEARTCFDELKQPERCLAHLEPDQRRELTDKLAEVDLLMGKIAAAKPPACRKVVDVHYAAARWQGKLGALKPAEKKQIVSESRKQMLAACTGERWTASVRGCIALGDERCFVAAGMTARTWGFPPLAVPIKTQIPACDAYGDALRALAKCTQIPRQAVLPMLDAFQLSAAAMASMTPDQRTAAASSCKQADSAIRQSAQSLGCTI